MKYLIITCDDAGPNKNVNEAINIASKAGVLSSTSIIANLSQVDEIKNIVQYNKNLSIGVHLNMSTGQPLTPISQCASLVDASGFFKNKDMARIESINPNELYLEFFSQLLFLKNLGISVTHIDNHHPHIYFFPQLFEVVVDLAHSHNLILRNPFTENFFDNIDQFANFFETKKDKLFSIACQSNAYIKKFKVKSPDSFFLDFSLGNRNIKQLIHIIDNLKPGIHELCVHLDLGTENGKKELDCLLSKEFVETLKKYHVEIVTHDIFSKS